MKLETVKRCAYCGVDYDGYVLDRDDDYTPMNYCPYCGEKLIEIEISQKESMTLSIHIRRS